MSLETLERRVRVLTIYAVTLTAVLIAVGVGLLTVDAKERRQRFTEIDVERVNIVEPDGRLSAVIANPQRMARVILDGREQPANRAPERKAGGIIFTDSDGNEAGGLIFASAKRQDGSYIATRSFTMDQHQQDQVLGIQYIDENGANRSYGLTLWERPANMMTIAEELDLLQGAPDQQARRARLTDALRARGITARPDTRRLFLGSQNMIPALRLSDAAGRERVRLLVDKDDTPHLEFLNAAGAVVYALPPQ
jgi:hypothetical protein